MGHACGRVLYFSDDDCLLGPETLELHLEAQREPCLAVGPIAFHDHDSQWLWRPRRAGFWNVNGANTSVPAHAFAEVGGFDETLQGYGGEDLLLGYDLVRRGLKVHSVPGAVVDHIGPPAMAGDLCKARQAGENAARIARRHPELAMRLGVHPGLLLGKSVLLPLLRPWLGKRIETELAYAWGAKAALRESGGAVRASGRS